MPEYPDYHRSIYSNIRKDWNDSPRVIWNEKGFSPNRYLVQPVDYDKDIEIEFSYERHDGTKCKHVSPCGPSGTYISNTQCGDAKTVTVKLPDHVDIDELEINIYGIDFDCEPAIAYEFPQNPQGGYDFEDGTIHDDNNYHTDDYDFEDGTKNYDDGYHTDDYDFEDGTKNYDDGYHTDDYDFEDGTKNYDKGYHTDDYDFEDGTKNYDKGYHTDDYDFEDGTKNYDKGYHTDGYDFKDGKKYPKGHHDDDYDFKDGKHHDGYPKPVYPEPVHPDDCKDDCEPFDPKYEIDCPEILPRCFNTWLPQTGCRGNTDINCLCGLQPFIDNVAGCIRAQEDMYDRSNDAYTYMAGICVEFIPKNPTIVAVCPPEVQIAPPPPDVHVEYPDNLEWKPQTIDTIVTKYPEVYEAKVEHPQTYSTYQLQTTVTVPQVVFRSPEPVKFDAPRQVYLAPGTPPPAQPYVPEHPPAPYPAPYPAPQPHPAPVPHPEPVPAPVPPPTPVPEPYPAPVPAPAPAPAPAPGPEPHPVPAPEPHPEPYPVDDWEPASTFSAVDSFDTTTYHPAPTDEPKQTGIKFDGSASRLGLGGWGSLALGLVVLVLA